MCVLHTMHVLEYQQAVSRRVCAQFDHTSCCSWNTTIEVMRCNRIASGMPTLGDAASDSFYIYHLPRPVGCPMAYCMCKLMATNTLDKYNVYIS